MIVTKFLKINRDTEKWTWSRHPPSKKAINVSYTWLVWNLLITIGIQSSSSNILDPVLDLSNPCIDAMAGTFTSIAHHTNLRISESNYQNTYLVLQILSVLEYLPFSKTIRGPPESPWQESLPPSLSPAQMWNLKKFFIKLSVKNRNIYFSILPG